MKNVLFLLDYYIENASANGICCKNVAKEMAFRGYRIFVGTYRPASAPEVETVEGVQVYKTWTMPPKEHHKSLKEKLMFYVKWFWPLHKFAITEVPERTKAICGVAKNIILEQNIDTVICVHLPVETIIAGTMLKAEFPSIKFCGYMLDSMSGGILPRFLPNHYARLCKIRWEDFLLKQMDMSILMESSRAHHRRYTSKQQWMVQAVYSDIPQIVKHDETGAVYNGETYVRMVYVGTLADNIRTPYYFFNVLQFVTAYHIELIIAGNNQCCQNLGKILEGNNQITLNYLGMVSHSRALELLKNAHILVNFGNINNALVPSKIFEYMSLGKPIVSTYRHSEDTAGVYLAKYPCALELDERNEDYRVQAQRLENFIKEINGASVSSQYVSETFYNNTPGALVEALVNGLG